jgi:hypothetical protein
VFRLAAIRRRFRTLVLFSSSTKSKYYYGVKSMKMKGVFIGLLVIIIPLAFFGTGDVEATNCYNLYLNHTSSCFFESWKNWQYIKVALHRDGSWEGGPVGTIDFMDLSIGGWWYVFGNAISLRVTTIEEGGIFDAGWVANLKELSGTKSGAAYLIPGDPLSSKANISKGQGIFYNQPYPLLYGTPGCWYLKKTKIDECGWISE